MRKTENVLSGYLDELLESYNVLNRILTLEAADIDSQDEQKLQIHSGMEQDSVKKITSLTKTIHIYLENIEPEAEMKQILNDISSMKEQAQRQITANISALEKSMITIKAKISSIKLPQSARRVYYSGNNPSLMDIEI